jgi:hypothetical protein
MPGTTAKWIYLTWLRRSRLFYDQQELRPSADGSHPGLISAVQASGPRLQGTNNYSVGPLI